MYTCYLPRAHFSRHKHVRSIATRGQRLASPSSGPISILLRPSIMAILEEQNFLCAMQGSQKELSRATNSPFVAGLPFLYDFLRDEGWLELAQTELFGNGVRAVSL